jgi:hypothetical protein
VAAGVVAEVIVHAEVPDPPRRYEVLVEHPAVVVADLCGGGPFVEAGVDPRLVDAILAEGP